MWFAQSRQRHPSGEEEVLDALESSVRLSQQSRGSSKLIASSKASVDIDDLIDQDIQRMASQGRSGVGGQPPSLTSYPAPRSPAEVAKTAPHVPRFRYMPGGVSARASGPVPRTSLYEDDYDDSEFDSDDDSEECSAPLRYGKGSNLGESLRLATFRAGGSDDEGEEEDREPKPRRRPSKKPAVDPGDSLSLDSDNTLRSPRSTRASEGERQLSRSDLL